MEDAPALLKLRESVCPDIWVEDPVVLLDRNLCGHPLAGLVWEGHIEKRSCWNLDGKKYRSGNAHVCVESRVYSYPFTWMTKIAGRANWLIWGEPTSCLYHVYLGCTQRKCKSNETLLDEYRKSSKHESLLEQLACYLVGRNRTRIRSLGLLTRKVMQRNAAILRAGEQNNPATVQSYNSVPC